MITRPYLNRLSVEALGYFGWGVACGSVSLGCAWAAGINTGAEFGAMVAGLATWSVLCAAFMARESVTTRLGQGAWGRAYRLGLRGRTGLTLAGAVLMGLGFAAPAVANGWFWLIAPDFIGGVIAVGLTRWLMTGFSVVGVELPSGFGLVYLTTLVQGAWVIASILALTGIIRCFLRNDQKAVASGEACSDAATL